ncbi:MAG: DNA primase [Gemmatimonadaceae bacterium]|nr:DNA primase [Gemmatimonadaceae bacterium]MDQ3242992.1 DNA primase [Gemmatimonadota bacterium]
MIPDEVVEQVREAADIVGIIGEYVPLKRTGADFRGPCPFHQGTRRNFSVSPAKRMYHCFVCSESGDVFKFLTKRLGMEWPEAVKLVGEKSGIEVVDTRVRREGPDPREPVWELHATAAAYFQKVLWDEAAGETARAYLAERSVSRAVADDFGLGFAPREIGLMRSYLNALGFDDARLLEAGLLATRDQESEPRPRFRGRLMFPIHDVLGRNVGFGGRLLGPGEPKYLNSSESPVFSKGKLLYALNRSRNAIRRADRALIVEGYFDALRVIASGIEEVVAPMGTAFTEVQATLLRKYSHNVFLLYDSDPAGLKATFRAGDELLRQGFSVRVVTLPSGDDPDSYARAHGTAGLEAQIASAVDVFDRKIQILDRAGWFGELQKKRRALDRLLPTIRATSDEIMRDLYIGRASEVTGVNREILLRELGTRSREPAQEPRSVSAVARETSRETASPGVRPRPIPIRGRAISAEKELVRAMLQQRSRAESIAERVGPDSFTNPNYKAIFAAMLRAGEEAPLEEVVASLRAEDVMVIEDLMGDAAGYVYPERTIEDSISLLHAREIENRMYEIQRLRPIADAAQQERLDAELLQLNNEIGRSGKGVAKTFRIPNRTVH